MRTWRWYSKTLLGLVLFAFAYFVWPTTWRYDHVGVLPVRTNRITGQVQVLNLANGCWMKR